MPVTIDDVKLTALTAPTVAMVITAIRLVERVRTRKFGVDDTFAGLSATMLLIFVVGMFVHLSDPTKQTRTTAISLAFVLPELFYGVLWSTRLSILFSIVRITPDRTMKKILYFLAAAFAICWAILFAQVFWVCESEPSWKEAPIPQCSLGQDVAIAQLITDVIADLALIAMPTKLLWNLRVSKGQRIRLLLTFSTSIVTTIVSLVHAYYVLRVGGLQELVAAIVENAVSLIVCNTPIIVTAIMQIVKGSSDEGGSSRFTHGGSHGTVSYGITSVPPPPSQYQRTAKASDALKGVSMDADSDHYNPYGGKSDLDRTPGTVVHVTQEHLALVDLPPSKTYV